MDLGSVMFPDELEQLFQLLDFWIVDGCCLPDLGSIGELVQESSPHSGLDKMGVNVANTAFFV